MTHDVLAFFGGIYSNWLSLETAVADVRRRGADALYALGMIYFREDDLAKARQYFEKGVTQAEGNVEFHIVLAEVAEKEKNISDAIVHYNRAVQLSPEDRGLRARRDLLVAGR